MASMNLEPAPGLASPTGSSLPGAGSGGRTIAWCVVTSLLLVGTGVVRSVQATRFEQALNIHVEAPFPLKNVPSEIDGWKVVDGSETVLDPLTTRITGSTDHFLRTYFDEMTGARLSVLVLYGPAEPVMPHSPQVCYPASGYRALTDPVDHTLRMSDSLNAVFRSSVFSKPGGRLPLTQVVYHSYRVDGVWSPTLNDRTLSHRNTGIFKVQVDRRVFEGERGGSDEPIESFLRKLLPLLETMIAEAAANPRAKSPTQSVASPPTPVAKL